MGFLQRLIRRVSSPPRAQDIISGADERERPEPEMARTVPMEFMVEAKTEWGEHILLVGDRPELGAWDPARGIPLQTDHYPTWSTSVLLPRGVPVEYKFIRAREGTPPTWELGPNRRGHAPP